MRQKVVDLLIHGTFLVAIGGIVGAAVMSASGQPATAARAPNASSGFELVRIQLTADGVETGRFNERYITFDYAVGTPGKLVIYQLEDRLFRNGFDTQSFFGGAL